MSWVNISPYSHFSLANIPFGISSHAGSQGLVGATRVGDSVIDLSALEQAGLFRDAFKAANTTFFAQVRTLDTICSAPG